MAPEVGLEPTTLRLTAECSAIELLRSVHGTQRELRCASSVITNAANRVKDIQRSYRSDLVTWTNDSRTMRSLARRVGDGWNRGCCSGLGVEQDGNVIAGEGAGRWIGACAYDGLVISARVEFVLEFDGELGETVGGVAHDEPGLTVAGIPCGHGAGLAGFFEADDVAAGDLQARLSEQGGYCGFLLVEAEGFYGIGKVFYGEGLVVAIDDGDAYGVDIGIEEVSTVSFGVHPEVVEFRGVG